MYGPLLEWRLIGLTADKRNEPVVAIATGGRALPAVVAGISPDDSRLADVVNASFAHLADQAPADWQSCTEVIRALGPGGGTGHEVDEYSAGAWPNWRESEASTNWVGHIGRSRERGLVASEQTKVRHHSTTLGHGYANGPAW